ncbi:MAG: hypothetical protein U0R80_08900 [Nocardioidaceae bacterium]
MSNSTVYTIGSALRQAENDDVPVRLMVGGQWFDGAVTGLDGDGVLLDSETGEVVIRLTSIDVVQLMRQAQRAQAPQPIAVPQVELPRVADVVRLSNFFEAAPTAPTEAPVEVPAELALEQALENALEEAPDVTSDEFGAVFAAALAGALAEAPSPAEIVAEELEDEPVAELPRPAGVVAAQLAAVTWNMEDFDGLPDDVTEAERSALAQRRALLAAQAATALEPEPVEVPVSDSLPNAEPELVIVDHEPEALAAPMPEEGTPADSLELHLDEEAPAIASSTQSDDWRAMLVSLRQQAQEMPQEPEKRRSWRIAR